MKSSSKLRALSVLAVLFLLVNCAHAILDANTNGMSDLWEKQHNNGNVFPPSFLPTADPDKDGWTNATEAIAGTDPHLANPPDGIIATTIEPTTTVGTFTLTWNTIVGKNYRLQASSNLTNWLNVGTNIVGTSNSHTIGISAVQPDTTVPPKLFWRIVASDLDTDGDGLTNAEENDLGIDSENANNIPGIPDLWLATHFCNELLTVGLSIIIANPDPDADGKSIQQESADGTDPNQADTDGDGLNDNIDADPLDAIVNWQTTNHPNFAVIEITVNSAEELTYHDHSPNGTILLGRPVENAQPTAVIIDKHQNVDEIPRTTVNGIEEGIWLTHLHDDVVPSVKNTATSDDSLYDPITNLYQPWTCPTNYQDMICDVRDDLVIGRNWINTIDYLLRYGPQGEALPGQAEQTNATNAYIDRNSNITSETHYWTKQPSGSYSAQQYPGTPNAPHGAVACANHSQFISGAEKKWVLVARSGTPGLLISANGGNFQKATKRFGDKKIRAVTRQGWIFDEQYNVWAGQKWNTLLEILGNEYSQAELLGINDEGLAVAKIKKGNQSMKIGLLVPVELVVHKKDEAPPTAGMLAKVGDTLIYKITDEPAKYLIPDSDVIWEWRKLKGNGTLGPWTAFSSGFGPRVEALESDAGIYQVRVKIEAGGSTQYFGYRRKVDDPHGKDSAGTMNPIYMAGQPDCVGIAAGETQLKIALEARSVLGSKAWALSATIPITPSITAPSGANKCNIFNYHMATRSGSTVPLDAGGWPPRAYDWYDSEKAITGWTWRSDDNWAEPGTIVSRYIDGDSIENLFDWGFRWPSSSAHCGIIDYDGAWINAGSKTVNRYPHLTSSGYQTAYTRKN